MQSTVVSGAPLSTQAQHVVSGVDGERLDTNHGSSANTGDAVDGNIDANSHIANGAPLDEELYTSATSQNGTGRRVSYLAGIDIEPLSTALQGVKRKRAPSPPWQFPIADLSTVQTSDGRRSSARFNPSVSNTPGPSESESQGTRQSRAASSRHPSPPWKDFRAEGPSSIQIDGIRKSGRVNRELTETPKRVSPRSRKQTEKLAAVNGRGAEQKRRKIEKDMTELEDHKSWKGRKPSNINLNTKVEEFQARMDERKPGKNASRDVQDGRKRGRRRKSSAAAFDDDRNMRTTVSSPDNSRKTPNKKRTDDQAGTLKPSPRIKLRLSSARHAIPPPHPHAAFPVPLHPPYPSLWQLIADVELKEMQQPYSENERGPPSREEFERRHERAAEQEMMLRRKIIDAGAPDGILGPQKCSIYDDVTHQAQPSKQYAHGDHLVSHALYFRSLQLKEDAWHRQAAKKLAIEALEYWKKKQGPTEEDLQAEAIKMQRLIAKQVVTDMKAKWDLVWQHVNARRKAVWEAEQEVRRQERLRKQLEWSQIMIAKQRGKLGSEYDGSLEGDADFHSDDSEQDGDDDSRDDSGNSEDGDDEDDDEDEDENMSDDESQSSEASAIGEDNESLDEAALQAYLAHREAEPPDRPTMNAEADKDTTLPNGALMAANNATPVEQDPRTITLPNGAPSAANNATPVEQDPTTVVVNGKHAVEIGVARADVQEETQVAHSPDRDTGSTKAEITDLNNQDPEAEMVPHQTRASISKPEDVMLDEDDSFSTDESVDMDSEDYESEEDSSDSEEDGNTDTDGSDGSDNAASSSGLLGFFSNSDRMAKGLPTPVTSAEGEHITEREHAHAQADDGHELDTAPKTADIKPVSKLDRDTELGRNRASLTASLLVPSRPDTPTSQARSDSIGKQLVPQPALLHGTLRSYQHAGLDWLASLYRNNTNGILADEMGLGKTIQTISLFAHVAETHNVWDAHLVIVPTSVILNWVTEFQKFLPGFRVLGYYGSTEERQAKRKGWVNDPHHENREKRGYNVIVTSYNIALKDINAIRNVQWHYMVLDEAHNIRNFNSQRFQNLIKLKTRARLLLTGTPLQNSLTELWSLLTFLTAGRESNDEAAHGSLEEFLARWKEPVSEIFERGVQSLSTEASKVVGQLHTSLRPFMLRRLKADVEKDLPKKTEHVVVCKLSKRQRQLYQDYMGLADTRARLTQGNAISAGKVLLSLRRVCNHPDLFDPRPIQTSYALEKSPLDHYTVKVQLIQRLQSPTSLPSKFLITGLESDLAYRRRRVRQISASHAMRHQVQELEHGLPDKEPDVSTISGCQMMLRVQQSRQQIQRLRDQIRYTDEYSTANPVYGSDLRELLTTRGRRGFSGGTVIGKMQIMTSDFTVDGSVNTSLGTAADKLIAATSSIQQSISTARSRADSMHDLIKHYTSYTPEVVSPVLTCIMPLQVQQAFRASLAYPNLLDPAHESRMRLSINFPDSRLLVYDAGKLQQLAVLLRDLQARGSRSLIFTQMSGTLNILEQFLGLMNLPYLRLDGSTPVERRQLYSAEFNRPDSKYQCMILSSRAGGVGLNLTGASSVIFYDLDWNPQMDKQCMDRAHRIGQVRDVEVYKMVSEKTVEENILRRANQKSLLDQTVIQEGHFTTDFDLPPSANASSARPDDDVSAAIDRFLSGAEKSFTKTIEAVEDKEDVQAAQQARKEQAQDDEDFAERSSKGTSVPPTPGAVAEDGQVEDIDMEGHVDSYMIRYLEDAVKHIPYVPPVLPTRDPGHRRKKRAR